jgi:hypothetical protein
MKPAEQLDQRIKKLEIALLMMVNDCRGKAIISEFVLDTVEAIITSESVNKPGGV